MIDKIPTEPDGNEPEVSRLNTNNTDKVTNYRHREKKDYGTVFFTSMFLIVGGGVINSLFPYDLFIDYITTTVIVISSLIACVAYLLDTNPR